MSKEILKKAIADEIEGKGNELSKLLEKYRVDLTEEIQPPEIALEAKDKLSNSYSPIGTLGNFSLVKGKAKSKKSFLINMAIAAATGEGLMQNMLRSPLKADKSTVLYFDTEQSKYHVQKAVKRICSQINNPLPNNLQTFGLRKENPQQRFKLVEYAIENTPNLGFVVIDGIRDLITSINDESESSFMATNLLKWTEQYGIHIIVVLHENPGSEKARGHLGTELTNKAETVIAVEIDSTNTEVSIAKPSSCRNKPFEPFAFEIDESGLPVIIHDYEITSKSSRKKTIDLLSFSKEENSKILNQAYSGQIKFKYAELTVRIKNTLEVLYIGKKGVGVNKVKEYISYLKEQGMIMQEGTNKPYTIGKLSV